MTKDEALKLALEALKYHTAQTRPIHETILWEACQNYLCEKREIMEFKQPTKILGPNLEETLNAAGFYRKKEWVGLTNDEVNNFAAGCHLGNSVQGAIYKAEAKLKEKNT
jgi:hypothetical protein